MVREEVVTVIVCVNQMFPEWKAKQKKIISKFTLSTTIGDSRFEFNLVVSSFDRDDSDSKTTRK